MTADTVILYDSDWNPQMDLQAQVITMKEILFFVSEQTNLECEILSTAENGILMKKIMKWSISSSLAALRTWQAGETLSCR